MRKLLSVVCVIALLPVFFSCKGKTEKDQIGQLLKEWTGKEIKFPEENVFSLYGKDFVYDTVPRTIVLDAVSSCGCTIVDYERKPASPGDSLAVRLCYKAEQKGSFYRTVHIYCNIDESVLQFELIGKYV